MPASYEMSWIPKLRRWSKMYRGRRYVVSCRQLGTPETKEGSYKAANEWWRQKLADIGRQADPLANNPFMETLREMNRWDKEVIQPMEYERVMSQHKPTTTDQSVGYQAGRYLDLEQARVNAGQLSLVEYDLARRCLDYFAEWIKPTTSVQKISPDVWENYWTHLMELDCSVEYKKKRFRYAKEFHYVVGIEGKHSDAC